MLLPTKVRLILEVLRYIARMNVLKPYDNSLTTKHGGCRIENRISKQQQKRNKAQIKNKPATKPTIMISY